nr:hypothetical protein [Tanacetum cinerariifolium]
MDIDEPSQVATHIPPFSPLLPARDLHPFSLLEPTGLGLTSAGPFVSHGINSESRHLESVPIIDQTDTLPENVPQSAPRFDDFPSILEEEQMIQDAIAASKHEAELGLLDDVVPQNRQSQLDDPQLEHAVSLSLKTDTLPENVPESAPRFDDFSSIPEGIPSGNSHVTPSAPSISDIPNDGVEEQMIQAAIEASKREAELGLLDDVVPQNRQSQLDDPQLEHVVSLSLKSVKQENVFPGLDSEAGPSETRAPNIIEAEEVRTLASSNGRLDIGGSPTHDGSEDADEQPLTTRTNSPLNREASRQKNMMKRLCLRLQCPTKAPAPQPPSPSLTAQRLIREQQDDEFLAALQADREKELLEQTAREAAMEQERIKEEEAQRKLEEEQVMTGSREAVAAKEASLPKEPTSDDENGMTLLVRMPDGSRRGRRFLRTDKLQSGQT